MLFIIWTILLWPPGQVSSYDQKKYLLFYTTYNHKTWQSIGLWGELTHDATWPSDHVVAWGHVVNEKLNISYSTKPVTTKLNKEVTYDEEGELIYDVTWLSDHKVTWSHVTNVNRNFFYCTTPVTTKIGRVETYNEGNSPIMSHDPMTTWSHEATRQVKNKKYLLFCKVDGHQTW